MSFLRFVSLLVLAIWIGGLVVLGGIAAPAIFATFEALDPASGRETAGLAFGAVFQRFQYLAWALGAVLLGVTGTRAALGPRPKRFAWRMWTITAMLAASVASGLYLAPRIDTIRDSVQGPVAQLEDTDARKVEFGRLHGASNGLMLVSLLGGLWLMWIELRDPH
jgi:uncharacterized membrane protein